MFFHHIKYRKTGGNHWQRASCIQKTMLKERAKESIKFKAKAVIYENETGFKIIAGVAFNAKTGERICKCSMKGQMFDVTDGDEVFATGDWDEHPKYGIGFKMDAYVKIIPQDKKSILWY